jgi:hypothetical protein
MTGYSQTINIDPGLKKLSVAKNVLDLSNLTVNKWDYDNGDGGTYICSSTNEIYNAVEPILRTWETYNDSVFHDYKIEVGEPRENGMYTTFRGRSSKGISNSIYRHGFPTQTIPTSFASLLSTKIQCTVIEKDLSPDASIVEGSSLNLKWKWAPHYFDTMKHLSTIDDDVDVVYQLRWFLRDVSAND